MLTLQLPDHMRHQGLAEGPNAFLASPEPSTPGITRPTPSYDPDAMLAQLEIACRYGAIVERVAMRHGMLPSVVAGFCSRRSGWGLELTPSGLSGSRDNRPRAIAGEVRQTALPPDGIGFVRGLMGLDYDRHTLARARGWRDPETNIDQAFAMIADYRRRLRRATTLQGNGLLRASLTAFEYGIERVQRAVRQGHDVDSPTEGFGAGARGCGRDVLLLAAFFQAEGWD